MDRELIKKIHERQHYEENVKALEKHLGRFFESDETTVLHEMLSPDFHLDVYFIQPKDCDYNLLITSGMSLLKMQVPESIPEGENYAFAELMLLVDKDLEFSKVFPCGNKTDWIIGMVKQMARFPHHQDTFLTEGHTLQAWNDIAKPYDDTTTFTGCILLPSATFDEDFMQVVSGDRVINIYSLFPLYKNELEYKIKNGYDSFFDLLACANAEEVFDSQRKNLLG